jgi:hypothetical protein
MKSWMLAVVVMSVVSFGPLRAEGPLPEAPVAPVVNGGVGEGTAKVPVKRDKPTLSVDANGRPHTFVNRDNTERNNEVSIYNTNIGGEAVVPVILFFNQDMALGGRSGNQAPININIDARRETNNGVSKVEKEKAVPVEDKRVVWQDWKYFTTSDANYVYTWLALCDFWKDPGETEFKYRVVSNYRHVKTEARVTVSAPPTAPGVYQAAPTRQTSGN